MKTILEKSLRDSLPYEKYRALIKELLSVHQSTTENGDESLVHYSELNDTRMDRLDKKAELNSSIIEQLKKIHTKQIWIVLTEGWCGDAAQNLPYIHKIAESSDKIELKIVLRDKHPELMDLFLTDGGKSIPKLIAINYAHEVLFTWGPRPTEATKLVQEFKEKHGTLTSEFKKDLQLWYTKNKGESLMADFVKLIK